MRKRDETMIKKVLTTETYEQLEREAIQSKPAAIDTTAMAATNGEDWKNCEAYENFRPQSTLPFCVFFDGNKQIKSGHYSIDTLNEKDSEGKTAIQRFYKKYPKGVIMVYDPQAPFGIKEYELI